MMLILSVGLAIGFIGMVLLVAVSILDWVDGRKARYRYSPTWSRQEFVQRLIAAGLTPDEATSRVAAHVEWSSELAIADGYGTYTKETFTRANLEQLVAEAPDRCPRCGVATYERGWSGSITCAACEGH